MKQRVNLRSPLFLQYESRPAEVESTNLVTDSEEFSTWSKQSVSISSNDIEAPDGNLTADKIESTSSSTNTYVYDTISLSTSTEYSASVYIKRGSNGLASVDVFDLTSGVQGSALFDFDSNTITSSIGSASFENASNGWYRIKISFTSSSSLGTTFFRIFEYSSTSGNHIYAWGAQLEESSQVTSYIVTSGGTATRAATTEAQEEDVTAELRIYSGIHETDAPTDATYTLTKSPENAKTTFEIAELIRDYIEQTTTKSSGTIWADVKLSDNLQLDKHYQFLATEGYIDNTEGLQTYLNAPSDEIFMQSNSTVFIPEGQELEIPVYAQSNSYYITTRGGAQRPPVYFSSLDDNSNQIEYVTLESEDDALGLYVNSTVVAKINVIRTECSKFANHLLMFVNKYGAKQDFYVNMKSTEKFKVKDDGFSRSVIDYNTLSVNNGIHSYKRRVLESKESYSLNTPFLDEENVQAFEELLLSEYVWLKKEGADYIPVVVKDMSMTRRTHLNDKLIQYTVEVESANHLVNIQR